MADQDGTEEVECSEIIYRALQKRWIGEDGIGAEAFIRRKASETRAAEMAVSVSRKKYTTARECKEKLRGIRAVGSLHVGKITSLQLGLVVRPDPVRDVDTGSIVDRGHALILNLPDPEDSLRAEVYASQLIKIARVVSPEFEEEEHARRRGGSNPPADPP